MNDGWIKLHRRFLEHPRFKDGDWLKVWTFLLLNATHKDYRMIFKGVDTILKPGQLITSRKSIESFCRVERNKVERILNTLESEHQIEQQSSNLNRLITILNWNTYQQSEHPIEQQVSNNRATTEQQVSTNKNGKKVEEGKESKARPISQIEVEEFCISLGLPSSDGESTWFKWVGTGFFNGKAAIKDWKATIRGWKAAGWMPSQKQNGFSPKPSAPPRPILPKPTDIAPLNLP